MRVPAPTSTVPPSASWRITTRLASRARRCDVPAGTRAPSSISDCPAARRRPARGVHVDDHLVALIGQVRIDAVIQGRLGEPRQRIRLPLRHQQHFRGRVRWVVRPRVLPRRRCSSASRAASSAFIRIAPASGERRPLNVTVPSSSGFAWRRPASVRHGRHGSAIRSTTRRRTQMRSTWSRRARPAHRPAGDPRSRHGHAGQRPDLGVGQLTPSERLRQQGQRAERTRHAHVFARRARGENPTRQVSQAAQEAEPVVPALLGIELANEVQQSDEGSIPRCTASSAISSPGSTLRSTRVGRAVVHGESPLRGRLYTRVLRRPARGARKRSSTGHRRFSRAGTANRVYAPRPTSRVRIPEALAI